MCGLDLRVTMSVTRWLRLAQGLHSTFLTDMLD